MNVAGGISIGVGVIGLVSGLFTLDSRYQHQDAAEQAIARVRVDSERDKLETDRTLAELEVKYQLGLKSSAERDFRLQYLKDRLVAIDRRLAELKAAK